MGETLLPFFGYLTLQLFVTVAGFIVVQDRWLGTTGLLKSWIFGQMLLLAVLQLMAVPMILLKCRFSVLYWSYLFVAILLFAMGLLQIMTHRKRIRIRQHRIDPFTNLVLAVAILMILWQAGHYFFGIHLDEDDARWLAEANDALEYGDMMNRSFHTGELDTVFTVPRDVSSPWPMMYAIVSKLLHTRPAVFAHTIYPPVEILIMYGVYWLIGTELYKRRSARWTFLLAVSLVILYFGGTVYTQAVFSLVRIWQGKATVAGVVLPLLFYLFIRANKYSKRKRFRENWITLYTTATAACLMSGMGISLGLTLIGLFGAYNVLAYQNWRSIPKWVGALLPGMIYTLVFKFVSK